MKLTFRQPLSASRLSGALIEIMTAPDCRMGYRFERYANGHFTHLGSWAADPTIELAECAQFEYGIGSELVAQEAE